MKMLIKYFWPERLGRPLEGWRFCWALKDWVRFQKGEIQETAGVKAQSWKLQNTTEICWVLVTSHFLRNKNYLIKISYILLRI